MVFFHYDTVFLYFLKSKGKILSFDAKSFLV